MEKIKQFMEGERGKTILFVFIVLLVGLASFELGRLSKSTSNGGVKVEYPNSLPNQSANAINALETTKSTPVGKTSTGTTYKKSTLDQQIFFASKRGNKYYPENCPAGKTLKQENRVYFGTRAEAEAAGYTLSSSCD